MIPPRRAALAPVAMAVALAAAAPAAARPPRAAQTGRAAPSSRRGLVEAACRAAAVTCQPGCRRGHGADAYDAAGVFRGRFTASKKDEVIVSLLPCDAMGSQDQEALDVLLQRGPRGWFALSQGSGLALRAGPCGVQGGGGRAVVLCRREAFAGGVTGESVCLALAVDARLQSACPLRLTSREDEEGPGGLAEVTLRLAGPGRLLLEASVGARVVRLDLDERGFAPTAETRAELRQTPIPGLEVRTGTWGDLAR